jgi:hypothetical protein
MRRRAGSGTSAAVCGIGTRCARTFATRISRVAPIAQATDLRWVSLMNRAFETCAVTSRWLADLCFLEPGITVSYGDRRATNAHATVGRAKQRGFKRAATQAGPRSTHSQRDSDAPHFDLFITLRLKQSRVNRRQNGVEDCRP